MNGSCVLAHGYAIIFIGLEGNTCLGGRSMKGMCLAAVAAGCFVSAVQANPYNLKGTYACLKDEHKDLSIIHGAQAWETGTIMRMYDKGTLGYRGDKIPSETIKLVYKLFHRPPGSKGRAAFEVTKPVQQLPHKQVAEFTASMLVFLKQLPHADLFKQYQEKDTTFKKHLAKYQKVNQAAVAPSGKIVLDKMGRALEKEAANARRLILESFEASNNHPQYESPLKELVHYPIKAFLECTSHNYMISSMPQIILQALLYKKTECDRTALATYYECLHKELDCCAYPLSPTDVFTPEQRRRLVDYFKQTQLTDDVLRKNYEEYVFVNLSPTEYPSLASYSDATINGAVFPDCMDTSLRNCLNFLAYNPSSESGKFEVSLLEKRLGTTVHPSVKTFYETHTEPSVVADRKVHNDWASMVSSNIPHLVYCRSLPMLDHGKKKCLKIPQPTDATAEFLTHNDYVALPEDSIAYDMFPSLRNFIVASDHLLGLQVLAQASPDEWTKKGFVQTYLPKILTALKAQVSPTLDFEQLDQNDGTVSSLFVPLSFSFKEDKPYAVDLNLHIEHSAAYSEGEVLVNNQAQTSPEVLLPHALHETAPESLLFLEPSTMVQQDIPPEQLLTWLFTYDLDDQTKLFPLIDRLPVLNENIVNILLYCAQKAEEPIKQAALECRMYQAAVQKGLADNESIVTRAVTTACEKVKSKNTFVRGEALQLFKTLLSKGKSSTRASDCAKELMDTGDRKSLSLAIALYTVLAAHGYAVDKASEAAQKGMLFNGKQSAGLRFEAKQLLKRL